ncbi:MAG: HAMP domain-containing sensor histidine kinase [Pseudomonadota bacterium]
MRQWLRPTLARRVVIALGIAFLLDWGVLITYDYWSYKQGTRDGLQLKQIGTALDAALSELDDTDQAQLVVAATAVWIKTLRDSDSRLPGDLLFELRDRTGKLLYTSAPLNAWTEQNMAKQAADKNVLSGRNWVYQRDLQHWSILITEPIVKDSAVLQLIGLLMLPYMLVTFPFVIVPVWLAVSQGLRPLRRLRDLVVARHSDDLSPIGLDAKYAELQPLVTAFEEMLGKLRHKVSRERAFVQDAAHELRTPMAVIATQAHVMSRSESALEREQARAHLEHAILRASHLTQQLLELATFDEVQLGQTKSVDVARLLRQLLAQQVVSALARRIDLSLDAPDTLYWPLDVEAFQSIVHNLIDNALRYIQPDGHVVATLESAAHSLTLSIADNGPGIAPELREQVFERFYRGSGHQVSGSGLGLAIVKQAAARMGCKVQISSGLEGRGCRFWLQIDQLGAPHSVERLL